MKAAFFELALGTHLCNAENGLSVAVLTPGSTLGFLAKGFLDLEADFAFDESSDAAKEALLEGLLKPGVKEPYF